MEALIFYFGKVTICSGVMFLYYRLSLKDKTFHHYNRFYLLSAMLISILLPLIKVEDFTIEVNENLFVLLNKLQNLNTNKTISHDDIYFRIIFSALGLVSLYFLGKFMYGIFRIQQLKRQFKKESFEGVNFYQTNLSEAPFSYFKNLFWKNTIVINSEVGKQILKHEMVHIEQKHSIDKIFIEVLTSVFWFNPFFHIIKKEINLIHEYLADKKAVKQSDTKAFAQMLLASHFSGKPLPATSPFLSSNLKKRLKMLQKPQTKFGYARRILALPVLFTVAFAYMVNAKNKEIKEVNNEIEKAVSEIKQDTVRPQKVEKPQEIVTPKASFKVDVHQKKITELSKKIEEKSKVLKTLKPESEDFEKNIAEIGKLSEEIGKISTLNYNHAEALQKMREQLKTSREYFKSDDYKNAAREYAKLGFDFPEVPLPPASPAAPNFPKVKMYSYNIPNIDYKNLPGLSKKEIRKLEKLAKEKAELAAKQAEVARQQAEIVREQTKKMQGNPWIIAVDAHAPKGKYYGTSTYTELPMPPKSKILSNGATFKTNVKDMINANSAGDVKYFIDGNASSNAEMQSLDPKNIESININKTKVSGKDTGEIHIKTKQK
ncbi:M56 family metallopeptidase [Chryseobacterium sp. CFS15]|uniref:M56 family metallopeptidase n=1 Tax=Chryseobacterium sp. CFS15 TaxID=2986946 RepID=UPI002809233D|nr:M56 family metallopeptidase [Chryseobacterium sp. CFS15]MDQ8144098.1 M56 family metallopeptidase [Chryseobacterium sp. CFS15]